MVGGDTLTCGVCRKEFALADIVKFIQHKVLTCNKENYTATEKKSVQENGGQDVSASSEPTSATTVNTTTTTSTSLSSDLSPSSSSTLTRRHSISTTTVPEVKSLVGENNNETTNLIKTEKQVDLRKKKDVVDAESNTVVTGRTWIFDKSQYAKPPYDSESIGFEMGKIVVLSKNYVKLKLNMSSELIFRIVLFHTLHSKVSLKGMFFLLKRHLA